MGGYDFSQGTALFGILWQGLIYTFINHLKELDQIKNVQYSLILCIVTSLLT